MNIKGYWNKLKNGDKILILAILIISLLGVMLPFILNFATNKNNDLFAVITISGEEKGRFALKDIPQEGKILSFQGPIGIHKIEITSEGVRVFAPSTDPLKICENTGWITRPGLTIVCIPNRLIVQLISAKTKQIDGITE